MIERRSSGQQVADHLRRAIFAGRYRPGQRIQQSELARELGVSRIPIREALVILAGEGRVRMELHKGAYVLPVEAESVLENAELTGMVYGLVARRATERATPEFKEALEDLEARLLATSSDNEIRDLNDEYLDVIMSVGASPRMAQILKGLRTLPTLPLHEIAPTVTEGIRKGLLDRIRAILAGDAEGADVESRRALSANAVLMVEGYRARGVLGGGR